MAQDEVSIAMTSKAKELSDEISNIISKLGEPVVTSF